MKPAFEGIDAVYKSKADNKDIRDLLEKLVPKATSQMVEFSKQFKGSTDFETCRNIFNYLKSNFTYLADGEEQIIKLPSALLAKKIGDCKSYSLLTAAILENLKIPYSFVYASYNSNPIPQHVYVVTGNGCIIDAVYGKFNQEKKPTYKYKKNMNVRYMAGIGGDCGCSNCNNRGIGETWLQRQDRLAREKYDRLKNYASEQQDAIKEAARKAEEDAKRFRDKALAEAKEAADKLKQGAKTVSLSGGRSLMLLIVKNNLDGLATKIQNSNTTEILNQWYKLGGNRTNLQEAIKTGASKPAKKFGLLPKIAKVIGNKSINGLSGLDAGTAAAIIGLTTTAGTSLGTAIPAIGNVAGAKYGAELGTVVVGMIGILQLVKQEPKKDVDNANAPLTPPSGNTIDTDIPKDEEEPTPKLSPKGNNTMLYVGGAALLAAGVYFATKKK